VTEPSRSAAAEVVMPCKNFTTRPLMFQAITIKSPEAREREKTTVIPGPCGHAYQPAEKQKIKENT